MVPERVARQAAELGLEVYRRSYPYSGLAWFTFAGMFLVETVALGLPHSPIRAAVLLAGAVLVLVATVAGLCTRLRKAVYLFEDGFLLVGMWGQRKRAGLWEAASVRIKRVNQRYPGRPAFAYAVDVDGRECFGFGERQIVRGTRLALDVAEMTAPWRVAAALLAITRQGAVLLGPLRFTGDRIQSVELRSNIDLPIAEITRIRLQPTGKRHEPFELQLSIRDVPTDVALGIPAIDRVAIAQLIASLADLRVS
ncbi:hypothetical protein ABT095_33550 [Kitasatospora sp. NPDC002227]|uniref:hypothetical protein n=1 Tax=Kitasatospora sp. NPDC002227 TaxID=3154773 RepID=UPI00332C7719